jgi:hypothetical protein
MEPWGGSLAFMQVCVLEKRGKRRNLSRGGFPHVRSGKSLDAAAVEVVH